MHKHTFYFSNTQRKIPMGKALKPLIQRCCEAALESEGLPCSAEISITFVSNAQIRKLNAAQRGMDRVTDVLSFPLLELYGQAKNIRKLQGEVALGDIVLSLERGREQAAEYGHSVEREWGFLTVHSTLHLLGYDHETETEEKIMFAKTEAILQGLGLER